MERVDAFVATANAYPPYCCCCFQLLPILSILIFFWRCAAYGYGERISHALRGVYCFPYIIAELFEGELFGEGFWR